MSDAPTSTSERLYYEDLEPGRRVSSPWYLVTREAIIEFGRDWDPYPIHVDEEAAQKGFFGGLVACTAHIFAIQSVLTHHLDEELAFSSGLGGDGLQLIQPVRPDDEVRLTRTYTSRRVSKSNPSQGVVSIEHVLERRADGEVVFRTTGAILMARREV